METITVNKGKNFEKFYTLANPDTTAPFIVAGWSLRATVRDYPGAVQALYEWPSGDLILEDGKATVLVPSSTSSDWMWSLGYYDIEMYNGNTVVGIDKGKIFADFEVAI